MTLEIISRPLSLPPVAERAMNGEDDSRYLNRPRGQAAWAEHANSVRSSVRSDWLQCLMPALQPKGEAANRISRSGGGAGFVVTTGQQPGLFGGPMYTLSKALSALALANALEALTGVPVAPVFWAATDDADFREASKTVIAVNGGARELVMDPTMTVGMSMSEMPLGDLSPLIAELAAAAGSGADPRLSSLVAHSYTQPATVGSAYVNLLREIFAPLGIAVLDASHEAVREASLPALRLALERGEDVAKAISTNNAGIERDGFSLQVHDVGGLSLVFEKTLSGRKRIPRKRGARDIAPGADLGPNVLLRPIVERRILPTLAYAGGPAEIAYFAQLGPIADTLGVARPLIVPRFSCTVIEPHVQRILDKTGLSADDLEDPHAAETRLAREKLPEELQREIGEFRASIEQRAASLSSVSASSGGLVAKAVIDGLRQNLEHRIDRFERRAVAASKRRHSDLMHEVATARGSLFPFGRPQERAVNFVQLLARYGGALQDAMLEKAAEHARSLL